MARRWTTAEDGVLRSLYPQRVPIREIATLLARSEDAVSERRRALGLPARPRQRPWSAAEDELLRAVAAAGLPAAALASRLGRDAEQIRRRRRALLRAATAPRAYTPADDDAIRACWTGARDIGRLAGELGRSPGSIRLRAQKLELHQPARRRRWRAYEDAAVRDGYERGLRCEQIAAELEGRTAAAVAARAAQLGLATYARKWTRREEHALRILTLRGAELERAAQMLARTPEALRARARRLGLTPLRSRRTDQPPQRWMGAEDEQLRLHPGHNPGVLAELLERRRSRMCAPTRACTECSTSVPPAARRGRGSLGVPGGEEQQQPGRAPGCAANRPAARPRQDDSAARTDRRDLGVGEARVNARVAWWG